MTQWYKELSLLGRGRKKIGTRPFVLFHFFFQRLIALYTHVRFVQDGASCDLFLALLPFCISVMNRLAYGKMLLPPEAYKHTYIQIRERKKKSKAFQHPFILSQFRLPSHPLPPLFLSWSASWSHLAISLQRKHPTFRFGEEEDN